MIDQIASLAGVGGSAPVRSGAEVKTQTEVAASGTDFATMLTNMASDAADTLKTAESVSIAGVKGNASVQQVVEAVMAAEQSLQTAIAVRDKVVSAYLEISRMTI